MPLTPGAPVSDTIKELTLHGSRPRSRAQIAAIAYANARKGGQTKPQLGKPGAQNAPTGSRFAHP